MDRKLSDKQRSMNLHTSLPLLAISEPAKIHSRIREIDNRLRIIDREVIILESERGDLYLEKAKELEKQDQLKRKKKLGNTND